MTRDELKSAKISAIKQGGLLKLSLRGGETILCSPPLIRIDDDTLTVLEIAPSISDSGETVGRPPIKHGEIDTAEIVWD